MDRPCQKSLGAEFSELRIYKDALRIHKDPGGGKQKKKKKKAYNAAYSFAQKLNLEYIFKTHLNPKVKCCKWRLTTYLTHRIIHIKDSFENCFLSDCKIL